MSENSELVTLTQKLEEMTAKYNLASNAKVFLDAKIAQLEANLIAVRLQRNASIESEAAHIVDNVQLKNQIEESKKQFVDKLNEDSSIIDELRRKFGETQHQKKNAQAELLALQAEKNKLLDAFIWFLDHLLVNDYGVLRFNTQAEGEPQPPRHLTPELIVYSYNAYINESRARSVEQSVGLIESQE